jgi:hypothetical protein
LKTLKTILEKKKFSIFFEKKVFDLFQKKLNEGNSMKTPVFMLVGF